MSFPGIRDYPKFINIRGESWEIRFFKNKIDNWEDGEDEDEIDGTLGLCHFEDKIIYIKLGQDRENTFKTFVHEVLHAVEDEYCLQIPHRIIYKFEEVVSDLLKENMDLAASLFFYLFAPEG